MIGSTPVKSATVPAYRSSWTSTEVELCQGLNGASPKPEKNFKNFVKSTTYTFFLIFAIFVHFWQFLGKIPSNQLTSRFLSKDIRPPLINVLPTRRSVSIGSTNHVSIGIIIILLQDFDIILTLFSIISFDYTTFTIHI